MTFVEIVVSGKERHADMSPASNCVDGVLKPVPQQDPFSRSEKCLKDGGAGREKFRQVVMRESEKPHRWWGRGRHGMRQCRCRQCMSGLLHTIDDSGLEGNLN